MNTFEREKEVSTAVAKAEQKGSALVIAVFVLALISVFVALALSRTATEAAAIGNETAEARTFYAAQGSLEMMTRNFNKVFETKLNPTADDLALVRNSVVPRLTNFDFSQQKVDRTSDSQAVVLSGGPFSGLYAIRDNWRLRTTVTDPNNIQVQLTRNILNNRIPIFQFGIFYDDDLELYRPPRFSFGGRVHSNRHFFISPGTEGVYFDSRVTASGQIITQSWRNGNTSDAANNLTYIKNASGVDQQLKPTMGSVLNTDAGAADNIFTSVTESDLPPSKLNSNFATQSAVFDGNLQSKVPTLKLPLKVGTDNIDLVEMVKRGKQIGDLYYETNTKNLLPVTANEDDITTSERFANKTGIRISLSDSKAKLPGCASGTGTTPVATPCGIRLDGKFDGQGSDPNGSATTLSERVRGYTPKPMGTYQATRVNGERLFTGNGREVWIKVETVSTDTNTGAIINKEITEDILSLGVTEAAPEIKDSSNVTKFKITDAGYIYGSAPSSLTATTPQTASTGTDTRSVIKLQRFVIPGPTIPNGSTAYSSSFNVAGSGNYNVVERYKIATALTIPLGCLACSNEDADASYNTGKENYAHLKLANVNGNIDRAVVPFPIEMFDTREGTFYDSASIYRSNYVTKNGVMSMVDIDVANLRRFLRGDFNGKFPTNTPFALGLGGTGLKNTDIPDRAGWVLYVSDRRGDADFDGEYDMEDIYGYGQSSGRYFGSDGVLQPGEDVNKNGVLDTLFGTEAAADKYRDDDYADLAAVTDHKFYRRGVRLINGVTLPGIYDAATPSNTKGFTVASENGIYVWGNYNATGAAAPTSTANTPYDAYLPFNTATHIPASIVGDAVTVLSNNWNDAESFAYPYNPNNRIGTTTQVRFAMISGDTISTKSADPNQGGLSPKLNGGVHNFKRFLETWSGNRLDYTGSLINLFNSHNNNGSFKCCATVYNPPVRNWVFDNTFLDPGRLPPGTPFFQYVQVTGFQRTND